VREIEPGRNLFELDLTPANGRQIALRVETFLSRAWAEAKAEEDRVRDEYAARVVEEMILAEALHAVHHSQVGREGCVYCRHRHSHTQRAT
jgi:hypothetical protein